MAAPQGAATGARAEGGQFPPMLLRRQPEVRGVGRLVVLHLALDDKTVGLSQLPGTWRHALAAGALAAKSPNAHPLPLRQHLDPVLALHGIRVISARRVPHREAHHLVLRAAELLEAELVPI